MSSDENMCFVSLGHILQSGIVGSYGQKDVLTFEELLICFLKWLHHFLFPSVLVSISVHLALNFPLLQVAS